MLPIPQELSERIDAMLAMLEADAAPPVATPSPPPAPMAASIPTSPLEEPHSTNRTLSGDIRLTIPGISNVLMVNLSETDVLIETRRPLKPGTSANLFVRLNGKRHAIRATAVRSTLHTITPESEVIYRTALQFEQRLPLDEAA